MHTYLLLVMYKYCRFSCKDWKQWRESYKSLVLLGFLLTHGPEDFAEEFQCDTDVIQELGTFNHIDEKGYLLKSIGFFFFLVKCINMALHHMLAFIFIFIFCNPISL